MQQTIELFCGKEKTFSSVAHSLGYKVFTLDKDPVTGADLIADVMDVFAPDLPQRPLIVWLAPPSRLLSKRDAWLNNEPADETSTQALNLIRAGITLVAKLEPAWWFMETRSGPLRKASLMAGFNRGYPSRIRQVIKHEEYGGEPGHTTDIWTNAFWWNPSPRQSAYPLVPWNRRVPSVVITEMFAQLASYYATKHEG